MGEPWEHLGSVPRVSQARRIPLDALDVARRIAEGEQALQVRLKCVTERADPLAAHDAEKGSFTRRLPSGLAAMPRSFAPRGTGDVGAAITQADGAMLPREKRRRGRASWSMCGTCAVARTCARTPGEPGLFPLDAQVTLPARGDSSCVPEWMTVCAVEPPGTESAGVFAQLFDLDVAESVVMEVAQAAPQDDAAVYAPRPLAAEDREGALLVVRVDGTGVPMLKEEAAQLHAKWGTGETRQQQKAALVGVSSLVDPKPRAPEALAARRLDPDAARAHRPRADVTDDTPRAQQGRRLASLGRTTPAVMALIPADAARRAPQPRPPVVVLRDGGLGLWRLATQLCKPWKRVTCVLDLRHVGGDLRSAAHALVGAGAKAGTRWVPEKRTESRRGRVGDVSGGLRHILTKQRRRTSVREPLANVRTLFHHHRRWMPSDADLAAGLPVGTGVVESACGSVVKPRREGDGQRWSLTGAEAMLTWRSLNKSPDPDLRDDGKCRARQMRGRLYGHTSNYRPAPRFKRVA